MKKFLSLVLILLMGTATFLTACKNNNTEKIVLTGTFIRYEEENMNGNVYNKYYFDTIDRGEICCLVSDKTKMPKELAVGNEYEISVGDIMTMSLPPMFSDVYSIKNK